MSVKTITLYSEKTWAGGLVKRRYEITLTDKQLNDHVIISMPVKQLPGDDGVAIADKYLAVKVSGEIDQYKDDIRKGVNPFLNESLWNSRTELLKPILDDALTLPADDPIVKNGLPFFGLVSDDEIKTLYSEDQAFVDRVRGKAETLATQLAALDAYEPEVL